MLESPDVVPSLGRDRAVLLAGVNCHDISDIACINVGVGEPHRTCVHPHGIPQKGVLKNT